MQLSMLHQPHNILIKNPFIFINDLPHDQIEPQLLLYIVDKTLELTWPLLCQFDAHHNIKLESTLSKENVYRPL
jgi:hypothetical protein